MAVTGPDFLSLQVRDLEASAAFYETHLGLTRAAFSPPHAVVFATQPIALAVREPMPGFDLDAVQPWAGAGIALWLHADDAQAIHDTLVGAGVAIVGALVTGPFGLTFSFSDPDGYVVTIHDKN